MPALFQRAVLWLAVLALSAPGLCAAERYGIDLSGKAVDDLAGPGIRLVVLVFAASDCPISNRYIPEIARLNREFASHGVRFWWVFPNPEDTAAIVSEHIREFGIHEDAVLDPSQKLVKLAQATITPEAAVFAAGGESLSELYHGRIDNRYLSIGVERPQPSAHDLETAIEAALAGKPIQPAVSQAVGCSIVFLDK